MAVAGIGVGLILNAFSTNILYFFSPTEILTGAAGNHELARLGGMVGDGTLHQESGTLNYRFDVTDYRNSVTVKYEGVLPDLFREGRGVIVEGSYLGNGGFRAERVLAKHDENYMPPEVADLLKETSDKR